MRKLVIMALALWPAALWADEVQLRGGGSVSGVVVARTATEVVVDIGAGRITVPMSSVANIIEAPSDLQEYRRRAATLSPQDLAAWRDLGLWAAERGLRAQSREAYTRVLALNPNDPIANQGMGRVQVDGRWMTEEDSYRAQGYVPFEGEWVSPEERQQILAERQAREAEEQAALDEQIQEAEARHAEKEAADREYWDQARDSASDLGGGLVYWDNGFGPVLVPDQPGSDWP